MQQLKQFLFIALILAITGCHRRKEFDALQNRIDSLQIELNHRENTAYLTQSILWYQHSPEMQALYIQSFNQAKKALMYNLKHKTNFIKKNAVVVDIDETILNNSLYQGWLFQSNNSFSDSSWTAWVLDTLAKPLPGAIDFLIFAKEMKCDIFYVSNRNQDKHFEATLLNLQKYNLPFADKKHLLLKTKGDTTDIGKSTKENRRLEIKKDGYEIMLFCGDQLADFDKAFDVNKKDSWRFINDSIYKYREAFGKKYIILPNPIYCDWLNQIINGDKRKKYSFKEMESLRRSQILYWQY